jgi:type III pantothenate kinase
MILLIDIGNTRVHVALAGASGLKRKHEWPTGLWREEAGGMALDRWVGAAEITGVSLASVVPSIAAKVCRFAEKQWRCPVLVLSARHLKGMPIDYPKPESIGADRLANALAAMSLKGAPVLAIDAGTAVTFDVVDRRGHFVGGVIAPGRGLLASVLHDHTALLPQVRFRQVSRAIGRSTQEAMLIGSSHGWLGLVRHIVLGIRNEFDGQLPVIVTGGDARWLLSQLPDLGTEVPDLTFEGLRRNWLGHYPNGTVGSGMGG